MIAKILSATTIGFNGELIQVECDASNGLPSLLIVGLGNKAVDEARERVRSAIKNSGLEFPRKRVTINLAPADLPKDGTHFDLAIALALLVVSKQLDPNTLNDTLVIGELGLDGNLKPVTGIINHLETALRAGISKVIIPLDNYRQASLVSKINILPATNLSAVLAHLKDIQPIMPGDVEISTPAKLTNHIRLDSIHGQEQAKRALLIAAAGHHNILLDGPPGSGKTMLAKALLSLLPQLNNAEMIEVTKIHSIAEGVTEDIITTRPFRSPHHSASHVSIIGGGRNPKPGEISLAHRGVLFLDEIPEYNRMSLEALRQPLEDKEIHISRTNGRVCYPADFMLIATKNPCPCGYANDQDKKCVCTPLQISNYQKRLSGPLLDRIDLIITVSRVDHDKLLQKREHCNKDYTTLISALRLKQAHRLKSPTRTNSSMTNDEILSLAKLSKDAELFLNMAAKKLDLSARSYFRIIKVGRTIADLDNADEIEQNHIAEALQYRSKN